MEFFKKEVNHTCDYNDVQELVPIVSVSDGVVNLKNGKKIIIMQIEPTNFKLKTLMEQESILNGYKLFLKSCNFNMQILIQSEKKDLEEHLKYLKIVSRNESFLRDDVEDYIEFIREILRNKEIISRNFYIMAEIKNNKNEIFSRVSDGLKNCDNDVKICNTEEVIKILKNCLNKKIIF